MYYSGKLDEEEWLPEDHLEEESEEFDEDLYSYTAGEYKSYKYRTDDQGRIIKCVADPLHFTKRDERLEHDSNTPGKLEDDQAGHLIADRFGGSPNLDNLVSMSSRVNLSVYKEIENKCAKSLRDGDYTRLRIDIRYNGNEVRPASFLVTYEASGEENEVFIPNT